MQTVKGKDSATASFLKGNNQTLNKTFKRPDAPEINSKYHDIGNNFSILC